MDQRVSWLLASIGCCFAFAPGALGRVELQPCKNNIAPERQIELGQKAAQQVRKQMPVLPDSSPVSAYVRSLGQKLVSQAPGYKWPYNFHVANVAEINAFALPGGTIFVNLGTIQAATDEAELAGVMAHEISHVVLQHSVCNAVRQQKVGIIAGLGQLAAGAILGGAAGQVAQQGIGMTAGLGFLKMSRGAEREADLEGVGILYDAGYDPRAMPQFFEMLQAKYGEGGAQFLSDHPNPGNRLEYINKELETFVPKSNYIRNTPQFTSIQKTVSGMRAFTAREVASGAWQRSSPNQTVGGAVNQATGADPVDLNTTGNWITFHGKGFSIDVPGNWHAYGTTSAAMMAPPNGIARSADNGAGTVIYGILTDRYQPQGHASPDAAMDALMREIISENPGLRANGSKSITVGDKTVRSMEAENPEANSGRGERDWIVAFPQSDGSMRYFVFVAPTPDFTKMQPVFSRMLQSIRVS